MELNEAMIISEQLAELKSTQGNVAKQKLAKAWTQGYHREFIDLVGNNKKQWNVTWSGLQNHTHEPEEPLPLSEVLLAAHNRLVTPSETLTRLCALLESGWPENVLKAIIDKTLDAGITVASIKKAQGAAKVFQPALCADWCKMNDKKRQRLLDGARYYSTPKMDGLRCIIKIHSDDRGAYSRTLKPLFNLDEHVKALEAAIPFPAIIDGEAFAADGTWNSSMTGAKKKGSDVPMVLYPFDMLMREEADSMNYVMRASERWKMMEKNIPYDDRLFSWVVHTRVTTIEEVEQNHLLDVADGWEGSVLHDADAVYSCKRSNAWVKVKGWLSSEFKVVGFCPGTGKHLGRLGAIIVLGEYDGTKITCEVGTGFKDVERESIWARREDYRGKQAEVKFFEVTEGSLRFPSFLRFRDEE